MDTVFPAAAGLLLRTARYEIFPMKGVEQQLQFLPGNARLTVACIPTRGLDATLELSTAACRHLPAANITPHLPARMLESRGHLEEILGRCRKLGITGLFIIGGDLAQARGPYRDSRTLIEELADFGMGFSIGVGAYPEPHPNISEEAHVDDLLAKQCHADYMATQICFDAETITAWLNRVRGRGVALPAEIGIVGPVGALKLMRIVANIGLGDVVRFLRKNKDMQARLRRNGGRYVPDDLCGTVACRSTDERLGIRGLHIYTLNQLEDSCRWRNAALEQLTADAVA